MTLLVIPPNPMGARTDGPFASSLSDPDGSSFGSAAGSSHSLLLPPFVCRVLAHLSVNAVACLILDQTEYKIKRLKQTIKDVRAPEEEGLPRH